LRLNGITADFAAEVLRGPGNHPVELRPQAFAVLRHLAENANRLVTKDELMEAVWPGIAVTDDSLVQCVHEIRRAIGDESHLVLRTVPKRGYRLDLPEAAATEIATPPSRPRTRLLAGLALGVGVVLIAAMFWWRGEERIQSGVPPSVAVLPFDDLGGNPDDGYFADGITEDLITDLAQIPGVFVIARNSVWGYRDDRAGDVRAVARALGVRYVVEGSVRRDGSRVRINAQLIDAADGHHVWADRYDGSLGNVFALQDQVISQIVSALAVKLPAGKVRDSQAAAANALAYDTLLRGRDALRRDTEKDTLAAIKLFERAVALDPEYGQAYAALAAAQWRVVLSYWFATSGAGWQRAYEGLMRSLAEAKKRPTSLAYAVSAQLLSLQGRYDEAFADIERAMAAAPGDPENHMAKASILNAAGRASEAEAEVRIAMRADPHFAPASLRSLAISLFNQGKYADAAEVLDRLVAQGSDVVVDYSTLVSALGHLGQLESPSSGCRV
jgi:TolB-like protein/DNA-binding winged helix-turn-helix (wHTH) protein